MKFDLHIDQNLKRRLMIASLIIGIAVIFLPMIVDHYEAVFENNSSIPQPPHSSALLASKVEAFTTPSTETTAASNSSVISRLFSKLFHKNSQPSLNNMVISQEPSVSNTTTSIQPDLTTTTITPSTTQKATETLQDNTLETKTTPRPIRSMPQSASHTAPTSTTTKNNNPTITTHTPSQPEALKALSTPNYNFEIQHYLTKDSIRTNISSSEEVLDSSFIEEKSFRSKQAKSYNRGWVLQLGSFSQDNYAIQLVQKLRANSFPAFISHYQNDNKSIHRVYVGPFTQKIDAENIQNVLQQKFRLSSIIIPFNPLDIT